MKPTRIENQLRSGKTMDGYARLSALQPPSRLTVALVPEREPHKGELAERISQAYRDARFVIDSSFFDDTIDTPIWDALLSIPDRLTILPQVREEISGWMLHHPDHPAAVAVRDDDAAIGRYDYSQLADEDRRTLLYYVSLLTVRKLLYCAVTLDLEADLGRLPTANEITRAKQEAINKLGGRAAALARKGARAGSDKETLHTDEAVTVTAFLTAISGRRTTVLLTRDEDIFDHFYKLQWLLDSHYRAMLLVDEYLETLSSRQTLPMPTGEPWTGAFAPGANLLLARSDADLMKILPAQARHIPIECWLLRSGESRLIFTADDEMMRLLRVKGATGGLNTDRLLPRNCHIWLAPLPIPMELRGYAAIAVDHRIPVADGSIAIPALDLNQAILTEERHQRLMTSRLMR